VLLSLAAGLDYRGLREAVIEGIPGLPSPPPGSLPEPEELEQEEERERAEFEAEFEQRERAGLEDGLDEDGFDGDEFEQAEPAGAEQKFQVTPLGEDLFRVHQALQRWLDERPGGRPRRDALVRDALGPLLCGWSGTIVHAIAPEPLSLDELDRAVALLDREGARTHVERMVRSGMAAAGTRGGEVRYGLSEWGRAAIAPLVAAVLYERRHDAEPTSPPDVFDVEAAFQMALPLIQLPPWMRGTVRLGAQIPGGEPLIAGATVQVDRGVVLASSALLDEEPETWVTGDPLGWCETVIDPSAEKLHAGGDTELAAALLQALHQRLFG